MTTFLYSTEKCRILEMLATAAIALSIYDLSHDPKRVVVEGCQENKCVRIVVSKEELEQPATLDSIANLLKSQLRQ